MKVYTKKQLLDEAYKLGKRFPHEAQVIEQFIEDLN